jgi:hypothetical protein
MLSARLPWTRAQLILGYRRDLGYIRTGSLTFPALCGTVNLVAFEQRFRLSQNVCSIRFGFILSYNIS